jgi:hypothetical protein
MPDVASQSAQTTSPRAPLLAIGAGAVAGVLVAATIALWTYYGSAVFYEMILTGLAACF